MTVVSNIHYNLSSWTSTTYSVGARISSSGNAYQCTTGGLSTAAPTGNGSNINNGGTAIWRWLSTIDYTSLNHWYGNLPNGPYTQNYQANLWNNGPITTTVGTPFFTTGSGGINTGGFQIVITCAPGEGLRDGLAGNNLPLVASIANGVLFQAPSSGPSNTAWFTVNNQTNITIDGIQIVDPFATSSSNAVAFFPSCQNWVLSNCIIDTCAQASAQGGAIVEGGSTGTMYNCLVVDRQPNGPGSGSGVLSDQVVVDVANCTFMCVNGTTTSAVGAVNNSHSTANVTNCAIYGYANAVANEVITVTNCVTDASGLPPFATNGGGNVFNTSAANQFFNPAVSAFSNDFSSSFTSFTDFRLKSGANCINAGTTDTTDNPSADDIRKVLRPQGTAWDVGAWEFVFAGPLPGTLFSRQQETPEQNSRYTAMRAGVIGQTVKLPWPQRQIFTVQHQPGHPSPFLRPGAYTQNVRPPAVDRLFTPQEQPSQPASRLVSGLGVQTATPLVDPWSADFSPSFGPLASGTNQVAAPPQVGTVVTRQEQVAPPSTFLRSGPYGQNVRPPVSDSVTGRQEQPRHTGSWLFGGGGTAVAQVAPPPQVTGFTGRQEQPRHPLPWAWFTVAGGSNVRAPTVDTVFGRQEQPSHPLPVLRSQQPTNVRPPVSDTLVTRREQPSHPLPWAQFSQPANPPPPAPAVAGTVFGRQEQPAAQQPVLRSGTGASVRTPGADSVTTRQEQPDSKQPSLVAGVYGANVGPPTVSSAIGRQEQPAQPLPSLRAGVQGPNVRVPTIDTVLGRQEQPGHPLPVLLATQPSNARAPTTDTMLGRQEQPGHPSPLLRPSIQGPNVGNNTVAVLVTRQEQPSHPLPTVRGGPVGQIVRAPVADTVTTRQEQPSHPSSVVWFTPPSPSIASGVQSVYTRQEQPSHPLPTVRPGQFTPLPPVPPVSQYLFTRQWQPDHPLPTVQRGASYTDRPWVQGRTVELLADV